jgi:hypothetical protein
MQREAVILPKQKLHEWVGALLEKYTVSAPVKVTGIIISGKLIEETEFSLDYVRTVIPPKKHLHPTRERMASYRIGEESNWELT